LDTLLLKALGFFAHFGYGTYDHWLRVREIGIEIDWKCDAIRFDQWRRSKQVMIRLFGLIFLCSSKMRWIG
jgi:hypothetical protein